jgi:Ca2+-binding EF-hand superfamily protein
MIGESKNQLFEVFKSFDKDSSGFVDKGELIAIAKQLN